MVHSLLRFHRRHEDLAEGLADDVAKRWYRRGRPLRGQFPREWVKATLWAWLRDCTSRTRRDASAGGHGFSRPLSDPVTRLLEPYRAGSSLPLLCPLSARLRRQAA